MIWRLHNMNQSCPNVKLMWDDWEMEKLGGACKCPEIRRVQKWEMEKKPKLTVLPVYFLRHDALSIGCLLWCFRSPNATLISSRSSAKEKGTHWSVYSSVLKAAPPAEIERMVFFLLSEISASCAAVAALFHYKKKRKRKTHIFTFLSHWKKHSSSIHAQKLMQSLVV